MYLVSILAVVIVTILMLTISGGSVLIYLDLPGLLLLFILLFPILISSNLLKDFNNAFHMVSLKKEKVTLVQLKRAIEAVDLVMKSLVCGGAFIVLFTVVTIFGQAQSDTMFQNLAVAILPLVYAFAFTLLLLPLKSRLKVIQAEYLQNE